MIALDKLSIVDWVIGVPEVDRAVTSLEVRGFATSLPQPGARLTPAGERLDWMTFRLSGEDLGVAPFFIRWSPNTRHPSTTAPSGCSLERFAVQAIKSDRVEALLHALGVGGIAVAHGPRRIEASLSCGSRRVILTSP